MAERTQQPRYLRDGEERSLFWIGQEVDQLPAVARSSWDQVEKPAEGAGEAGTRPGMRRRVDSGFRAREGVPRATRLFIASGGGVAAPLSGEGAGVKLGGKDGELEGASAELCPGKDNDGPCCSILGTPGSNRSAQAIDDEGEAVGRGGKGG